MKRAIVLAVFASVLAVSMSTPALAHHDGSLGVFPPDSSPYGTTYPEWLGAYMIWSQETPWPENPLFDPSSPRNCDLQPGGDVVFLGGGGGDCSVPAGAALAFSPALAWFECSTAEGLGETWRELRTCAREHFAANINPDLYHRDDPVVTAARDRAGRALYEGAGDRAGDAAADDARKAAVAGWSLMHGFATLWLNRNLPPDLGPDPRSAARDTARALFRATA